MSKAKIVTALVLIGLVLLFAVQNAETVELKLLIWSFEFPRSLLLFLVVMIGFVAGWFARGALRLAPKPD